MKCNNPFFIAGVLSLAVFILWSCILQAEPRKSVRNVLILNSYHPTFLWTERINKSIRSTFKQAGLQVNYYSEYLDTKRFSPETYSRSHLQLFEKKYRNESFDLIISSDNNALDFLLQYRGRLFPGVPVVFCGYNNFSDSILARQSAITGVVEEIDIAANLRLIQDLLPRTQTIALINDSTPTGIANQARFEQAIKAFEQNLDVRYLVNTETDTLKAALKALPQDAAIMLFRFHRDKSGVRYTFNEYVSLVTSHTDLPIFTLWYYHFAPEVLGGIAVTGNAQGRSAAQMGIKILQGTPADSIPIIRESPNHAFFNYPKLREYEIAHSELPQERIILNEPETFLYKYRPYIIGAGLVGSLLVLIIIFLWLNIQRRKSAEHALRVSEQYLNDIIEFLPIGIGVSDFQGNILKINRKFRELFGYRHEEIPTISDWTLRAYPDPDYRARMERLWGNDMKRANEEGIESPPREYRITCKDGSEKMIEITLKPGVKTHLVTFADLTGRRKAEQALADSERRFEKIMEHSPDAIFIADRQGYYRYVNKKASALFGYTLEELKTMNIKDLDAESTGKELPGSFHYLIRHGSMFIERNLRRKDGRVIPVDLNAVVLPNGLVYGSCRDISQRKQVEQKLRDSERELTFLFNTINDPVFVHKFHYEGFAPFEKVNDQACRLYGYSRETFAQMTAWDISVQEDAARYARTEVRRQLDKQGRHLIRAIHVKRSGEHFPVEINSGVTELGGQKYIISVVRDISERVNYEEELEKQNREYAALNEEYVRINQELNSKIEQISRINQELEKARDKAQESDRLKSAFLANMSHEIRTPLNSILGFSAYFQKHTLSREKIDKYARVISKNGNYLLELINDIIDISKIESGELKPQVTEIYLPDFLDELYHTFYTDMQEKGKQKVAFRVQPCEKNKTVETDETRLRQIMINLLKNAIKFTDEGSITLGATCETHSVVLYVKDTGIGISKEDQKMIFKRFRQGTVFTDKQHGGTGLGLAIAKASAAMLGGELWVESALHQGASFYLRIPLKMH